MTCFTRNIQQRTLWFGRKLNNSQKCRWYIQNMYKKNFIHYIRKGWSLAESLCLHRGFLMFLLVIFSLSSKGNILWWVSWKSPVGTLKLLAGNIENPSRVSWKSQMGYLKIPVRSLLADATLKILLGHLETAKLQDLKEKNFPVCRIWMNLSYIIDGTTSQ